ncbi:Sphingomyelin phosphodiesterase [Nymphon striatum]|nr:Sphingomyelin phosphodiesterase [Nymphon striatum]
MKNEVFYVATQLVLSPDEACGYLLGLKCGKFYNPYGKWTIKIPPGKPKTEKLKSKKLSSVLKVLQLTDLHHDPYYAVGSNAFCGEPLCCRASNGFPSDVKSKAGKWGNYQNCDLPLKTLKHMLDHISKSHEIDYIFWTGDFPSHDVWNQTRSTQLNSVQKITDLLVQYFPKIPVFPALGNHESYPVDSFPPPYVTGEHSIKWLYNKLNSTWTTWLDKDKVSSTIIKGAYYSIRPKPGYRIISLNMNYCNTLNWWLLTDMTDPAGELAWLVEQLLEAEKLDEKVHIIGHIPPPECPKFWSYNYNNIINRFENTIQAAFFGHTHADQLHLHYEGKNSKDKRATVAVYVAPSGTTYNSLNPAYRIYDIDGGESENNSWAVLNHDSYFLNITDANLTDKPQWLHEYNAKEAYGLSSLSPEDWDKVVEGFKTNKTSFDKYYRYQFHLSDATKPCDDACRKSTICAIQAASSGDKRFCYLNYEISSKITIVMKKSRLKSVVLISLSFI